MSRNLCRTDCRCGGDVVLVALPAAVEKLWGKFHLADAECSVCKTKYSAWIDCPGGAHGRQRTDAGFFDLSYRSSFNDEPGPDDVPREVEVFRVALVGGKLAGIAKIK